MPREVWKSSLTDPQRQLVELFEQTPFGRIGRLIVRDGQPVLHPKPRVYRELKLGSPFDGRREHERDDYPLKGQFIELISEMARLQNGVILDLTIKHGLPFSLVIDEGADDNAQSAEAQGV